MTAIPETHRDILDTAPVGIVATVGPDGMPQVTANWFLAEEDGTVRMSLNTTRQKVKNLMRRHESSVFFLDPATPPGDSAARHAIFSRLPRATI